MLQIDRWNMEFDDAFKIKTNELLELCYDELGTFLYFNPMTKYQNYKLGMFWVMFGLKKIFKNCKRS